MTPSKLLLLSLPLLLALPAAPQQARSNIAASASTAVPPLIPYSGVVNTAPGTQPGASASITFLIYKDEQGGEPLFAETQTVAIDAAGHYKAQLGATLTNGIPFDLFATGGARWLEVQVAGEAPQPRVLLVSVPYALKAADAATLGGLPPSAFALARTAPEAPGALSPAITPTATNVTTTGGLSGYIPEFSGASSIVDSPLFVSGTNVGIGTAAPAGALDVRGTAISTGLIVNGVTTLGGAVELAPLSFNATPATGYNSQLLKLVSSAYNSASKAILNPRFVWQATVTGNNTAAPSATLNLLSSTTAAVATPTGFYFNPNGTIHFAPGQTFPGGPGMGTITGVTAGSALTGGGASGNVTLNLDTTKVPLLAANNTFTGIQSIHGNLSATGTASAGIVNATNGFDLGGALFAFGSLTTHSVYVGFAGNSSSTGSNNTAAGFGALSANTTGGGNTASGDQALALNTMGSANTASGSFALNANTTGSGNTASGWHALISNTTGSSNTAAGLEALSINTTGDNNTASGAEALSANTTGRDNTGVGLTALLSNTTGSLNTATGVEALLSNTTGSDNTASGVDALYANTTGNDNTASGTTALSSNTIGFGNTASGFDALYSNTSGSSNTAIGSFALNSSTTGSHNVAIGNSAGNTGVGQIGDYNTAVGSVAGFGKDSITGATAIGAYALATESNTMVLGCIAPTSLCPGGVRVGIGTSSPDSLLTVNGSADKPGGGSWGTYSDGRLKTVNGSFGSGLGQVMQLRPIRYRYKPDNALGIRDADEHIGVVAQEVQRVIPEAVTENGKGYLLVNNDPIIWSMVNAIKEQQREIEQQRKLLRAQIAAMQNLAAEVRETRKTLRQVKAQAATGQLTMVASK